MKLQIEVDENNKIKNAVFKVFYFNRHLDVVVRLQAAAMLLNLLKECQLMKLEILKTAVLI